MNLTSTCYLGLGVALTAWMAALCGLSPLTRPLSRLHLKFHPLPALIGTAALACFWLAWLS